MRTLLLIAVGLTIVSSGAHATKRQVAVGVLTTIAEAKGKRPSKEQMAGHREKMKRMAGVYSPRMQHLIGTTLLVAERAATMNVGSRGGRIGKAPPAEGGETGWSTSSSLNGATTVEASIDNHQAADAPGPRLVGTEHYKAKIYGNRWFGRALVEKDGGLSVVKETIVFGKRFGGKGEKDKVFGVNNF